LAAEGGHGRKGGGHQRGHPFPESSMLVSGELPGGEVGHHGAHVLHRGREHGRLGVRQAGAGQVVLRLRLVLLHLLHLGEQVA